MVKGFSRPFPSVFIPTPIYEYGMQRSKAFTSPNIHSTGKSSKELARMNLSRLKICILKYFQKQPDSPKNKTIFKDQPGQEPLLVFPHYSDKLE